MTDTMARPSPVDHRRSAPFYLLGIAVFIAALVPIISLLEDPPRAVFTVRNDTAWDLALVVRTGERSVMPIMTIGAESTREATEVIIPGDEWRFVWRFAGDDVGTSTVDDNTLQGKGYVLLVPDEVGRALLARDAPPTP